MFTGIIQELGVVGRVERSKGLTRLSIHAPKTASKVRPIESVSVNGVCLSVVDVSRQTLVFEVIPETQRLTTLGTVRAGTQVHLEPSLSLTDRLSGHLVFGHVDAMGTVVKRRQMPGELVVEIRVAPSLRTLLVPKGPVAVDGVSLTVGGSLTASTFAIHLIPETLRRTSLSVRAVGERVNVELDYFAKLMRQWLTARQVC